MLSGSRLSSAILLAAEAPAATPSWWEVTSGLLLALAGIYATWAQFVYPKIAERKAKRAGEQAPPAPAPAPAAAPPPVDPVIYAVREQSELIADLREELTKAHRRAERQAVAIARLTADREHCTCTPR